MHTSLTYAQCSIFHQNVTSRAKNDQNYVSNKGQFFHIRGLYADIPVSFQHFDEIYNLTKFGACSSMNKPVKPMSILLSKIL